MPSAYSSAPPPALLIRDLARDERPREKLLTHGPHTLSVAELLALLLNTGSQGTSAVDLARRVLRRADGRLGELARLEVVDLVKMPGVGPAKAARLVAALELGRRRALAFAGSRPVLLESAAAYRYLLPILGDLNYEEFHVLCLNRAGELVGQARISEGGVTATVADAKRIFRTALSFATATSLVLAHNHPSGQAFPSVADIRLTKKIRDGAFQLDLCVVDHLIVAGDRYFSFADEGLLYPEGEEE